MIRCLAVRVYVFCPFFQIFFNARQETLTWRSYSCKSIIEPRWNFVEGKKWNTAQNSETFFEIIIHPVNFKGSISGLLCSVLLRQAERSDSLGTINLLSKVNLNVVKPDTAYFSEAITTAKN